MARLRNKTTDELDVRLPDWTGHAKPDELIEVPDDIFKNYEWPDTVWDVVEGHKRAQKKADAAADSEEK